VPAAAGSALTSPAPAARAAVNSPAASAAAAGVQVLTKHCVAAVLQQILAVAAAAAVLLPAGAVVHMAQQRMQAV
jgi:hypothetical protein